MGLIGWHQKVKDMGLAAQLPTNKHSRKPGEKYHSNGTQNGHLERSNLLWALSEVDH